MNLWDEAKGRLGMTWDGLFGPAPVWSNDPKLGVQMDTSWWDKIVNITTGDLTSSELQVASGGDPVAIADYKKQHGNPVPSSVSEAIAGLPGLPSLSDVFGDPSGPGVSGGLKTLLFIGGAFGLVLYTFSKKGR